MSLQETLTLHPNGSGANAYLSRTLVNESRNPLTPGDEVTAQIVPHVAIILFPPSFALADRYPFELRIHDPSRIKSKPQSEYVTPITHE